MQRTLHCMVRFCFLAPSRRAALRFLSHLLAAAARFFIPGTLLALSVQHRCRITQF
ncbi:hypothetical protein BN135_3446 [Cronobacter muytjensii 530]